MRDHERIGRIQRALREAGLDALVCALPSNVLLLSDYWPVVGTSVAVVTREGAVGVALPEDEQELAAGGWADVQEAFAPSSLQAAPPLLGVLAPALSASGYLRVRDDSRRTSSAPKGAPGIGLGDQAHI